MQLRIVEYYKFNLPHFNLFNSVLYSILMMNENTMDMQNNLTHRWHKIRVTTMQV